MILTSIPVYGLFIFWTNKPVIFHKIIGKQYTYYQILTTLVFNIYITCKL